MEVLKVMLERGAIAPSKAYDSDAGYDICTREEFTLYPNQSHFVDTGVHIELPAGYAVQLISKSGLNCKHDITSTGLIDSGYSGSIGVKLYNHGYHAYHFSAGDKISQMLIVKCESPDILVVEDVNGGERGDNGFGSTGK